MRHSHQELTKAIVELLDVSKHAHADLVLTAGAVVHAVPGERRYWMGARQRSRQNRDSLTAAASPTDPLQAVATGRFMPSEIGYLCVASG
jgi:hypothetical protein